MALWKDQLSGEQTARPEPAPKAPEKVSVLAAVGEPAQRPAATQNRQDAASMKESIIAAGLTIEGRSKARGMSASPVTSRAM